MSRTFVHRPAHVWLTDPAFRVEVHDHREGPCDLPPLHQWLKWMRAPFPGDIGCGRCEWAIRTEVLPSLCGCGLCTEQSWRRENRRRERHAARHWLRTGRWREDWDL